MNLLERIHTEFSEEQQKKCYDALAIYNYSRLSGYPEKYCDMFAEAVQAMVDQKRIQKLYGWEKSATAGAEDYKKVLNRGQTGWEKKQLGKAMLEAYVGLDDQDAKDAVICGLAESEAVILEAMEDFNLMLEAKSTKGNPKTAKGTKPMTAAEKEKAAKLKEMEAKAKAEKKEKMKKRIKKALVVGAATGATVYAVTKASKSSKEKVDARYEVIDGCIADMHRMVREVSSDDIHDVWVEFTKKWNDFSSSASRSKYINDHNVKQSDKGAHLVMSYYKKIKKMYDEWKKGIPK